MRHYEIVALVHPDQSEQQNEIIDRYRGIIEDSGGKVHRCEDWGRRKLAYPIHKLFKAGYFLMNVECEPEVKDEIENGFRYNDSIIRSLVIRKNHPVTEQSPIMKNIILKREEEEEQARIEAEQAEKERLRQLAIEAEEQARAKQETESEPAETEKTETTDTTTEVETEETSEEDSEQAVASDESDEPMESNADTPDSKVEEPKS